MLNKIADLFLNSLFKFKIKWILVIDEIFILKYVYFNNYNSKFLKIKKINIHTLILYIKLFSKIIITSFFYKITKNISLHFFNFF